MLLASLCHALQSATNLDQLCRVVRETLPRLIAHDWAVFVPNITDTVVVQLPSDPLVSPQFAHATPIWTVFLPESQPVYGSQLRRAPAAVRAALRPFTDSPGRYALLPLFCGDVTALLCVGSATTTRWNKSDRSLLAVCAAALQLTLQRLAVETQLEWVALNTSLLDGIRAVIARTLELPELLRDVVEQVALRFGYSLVSLYLLEGDELRCQHQVGYEHVIWTLPVIGGVMERAVQQRQSILLENVDAEPRFVAAIPGIVSEIAVPLQSERAVFGVLNVESTREQQLSRRDLALLEAVGVEVSIALERAMLYTATVRQAQQLAVIERLRAAIASQLDPQALGRTIVRSLQDLLRFEFAGLYLCQDDTLHLHSTSSTYNQPITRISIADGLTGMCVRKRQPLYVPDVHAEAAYLCADPSVQSGIFVPLFYGDRLLGTLIIESRTVLTSGDFEIVTALSEQIAAALEQSRRFEAERRARERIAFMNQLLHMVNHVQAAGWPMIWEQLAVQLGSLLRVDQCVIALLEEQPPSLVTWQAAESARESVMRPLASSQLDPTLFRLLEGRKSIALADVSAADGVLVAVQPLLLRCGIQAMAAAPVVIDDGLVAAVGVFQRQRRVWSPEDVVVLEMVAQHVAAGLRQTKLREQEAQRRRELELVYQTALEISAHHDLQSVLQAIADRACMLLKADAASLYLLLPDADEAELRVGVNIPDHMIGSRMRRNEGLLGHILQTRQSYLVPNYAEWTQRVSSFTFESFGATLGIPLIDRERVIGMLTVAHIGLEKRFEPTDQRLSELLAAQAAQAIVTAQLLEDVRRRNVEMEAVYANALALTTEQEVAQVLQSIAERACILVGAASVGIHLLDQATQELELAVCVNVPQSVLGTRINVGMGVAGLVAQSRSSLLVDDCRIERFSVDVYADMPWRAMLCVPLHIGDSVLGTITLAHTIPDKRFTRRDQQLIELFASQGVQATERARRFERERMLREDAETSIIEMQAVLQELEQTNERIVRIEKFRMLGELASEVAHDFNNALVSMLGNTQFLLLDETEPDRIEMLRAIEAAARDSASMVKRIQEFGRSHQSVPSEEIDVNAIVRDAVLMTQGRWRDKLEPSMRLMATAAIQGSATELRRVLINLIVNALDAMPNGGALELATSNAAGMVTITVRDTGMGMPPHVQSRIFDPFFTTKAAGMGTGLGLSICHQIVTRHGGMLTVASTPGRSTTFTIQLPSIPHLPQPAAVPDPPAESFRVVLCEPDPLVQAVLERFFEQQKVCVAVAQTVETLREALATGPWNLLLVAAELFAAVEDVMIPTDAQVVMLTHVDAAVPRHSQAHITLAKPVELHQLRVLMEQARSRVTPGAPHHESA